MISQGLLQDIHDGIKDIRKIGNVAQYIPALREVNPDQFGMMLLENNGRSQTIGDFDTKFSIQSISKVITLIMAMKIRGNDLWKRLGKEPSGSKFNSLVQLEYENGIPRNPFINAGALVITDMLISEFDDPKQEILDFVRKISCDPTIDYDIDLAKSEQSHGYTNTALVNFMKSHKNIHNDVEEVLDVYFHQCSLMVTCKSLAHCFSPLANRGYSLKCDEEILTTRQAKRVNAIMLTCGFYDQAGEIAFRVGLPGKSGVSGGVVAICPDRFSAAVWSPRLNKFGNSVAGIEALDRLTTKTGLSIF